MRTFLTGLYLLLPLWLLAQPLPEIESFTRNMQAEPGFFPCYWDGENGRLYLEVIRYDTEFLYVNSLSAGVGSNDLGLDRGQLGDSRIVKFIRQGRKVLLLQPNYAYRAQSDSPEEREAVAEAFAQSVLAGFEAQAASGGRVLIDLTPFLLRDAHGLTRRLRQADQGTYQLDEARSMIWRPRTRNFPLNSEFEALLTFTGEPQGREIRSVTPTPEAVTVRQHHSFVQLPGPGYEPRPFDPRSGYMSIAFQDYATPLDQPLTQRYILRHRLKKQNPGAAVSLPEQPIVYYLDRGTPEPIRTALLEGAAWWAEAFEAAGFRDAFRVEMLPLEADPLDVRYNVIQWVHRSTRGWSYGASVIDPRTGEIIKGHVSLGSLRVRQDFLIAQGLLAAYENGSKPDPALEAMALARLRQLAAHEVGHTLGLVHNYIASTRERASVMDYPHPLITQRLGRVPQLEDAYATGIGAWDKRAIIYGYQPVPAGPAGARALQEILAETQALGLPFLSDADARPAGSAHPHTHLWDNGADAASELERLLGLRAYALEAFGPAQIAPGQPLATLEEVLVPLYFMHRYQVEATAKVVGGLTYGYQVRGDDQAGPAPVDSRDQKQAVEALLTTLTPRTLAIPEAVLALIPPRPPGYPRSRETFPNRTGFTLDPLTVAEAAADHTLALLLHPQRANRLLEQQARDRRLPGLDWLLDRLADNLWGRPALGDDMETEIRRLVQKRYLEHLMYLSQADEASAQVQGLAQLKLRQLQGEIDAARSSISRKAAYEAHLVWCQHRLETYWREPAQFKPLPAPPLPDGAPIGMDCGG